MGLKIHLIQFIFHVKRFELIIYLASLPHSALLYQITNQVIIIIVRKALCVWWHCAKYFRGPMQGRAAWTQQVMHNTVV